ncbi:XdhC family protein [Donghicola tyrosinivorans]|uniref:Xanthine dehydrogenase accessory factor n=1 Tax=Donghicola tyrosinivorans TaxID=1652492 RepID=A0A2T0X540_9RHOB|nr:XdhC family protein [Donghicola tyrosinivorans]PRY94063.1 xanthine dehydrogenase accessory factor [Donghicola tyrosinivorans]
MTEDNRFDDIPERALAWHTAGRRAALATVVETWGSAPRRVGSQLAIAGDGEMAGSVSGGCVEGAVIVEAMEAMEDGQSRVLEYGVSDGDAFAVGLACGGTIRILVEPVGGALSANVLTDLVAARAARTPVAYVTDLEQGGGHLAHEGFEQRFRMDRSGVEEDGSTFVAIHNPPLRMILVGGVHIAQALVPMARIAGFDPIILDPRESFANAARFPDTRIVNEWPDEGLDLIGMHSRTALVLLTHDPKLDDPALLRAFESPVFYIGALGSTRTHAKRVDRLTAAGITQDQIARIDAPVGMDIGASGPAEIAVSILAQVIHSLRRG